MSSRSDIARGEPALPVVGRYSLAPSDGARLLRRQVGWTIGQAAAAAGLAAAGLYQPLLAAGAALAAGLLAASLGHPARALAAAAGVLLAMIALAPVLSGTTSLLSPQVGGLHVLALGAAAGAGLAWLEGPRDGWRLAQTALAGLASAGIGWWAANRLVVSPDTVLESALQAGIFGLIASQALVVAALRYRGVERIPSPARIRATLRLPYQAPCLKAQHLDEELAKHAPDVEIRDGLGEVAAWIYKLQWSLQVMDREIEEISDLDLQDRIARIYAEAGETQDSFIRERRLAAAQHLERLAAHRGALALERQRVAALVEYAAAYQEEARAGLVLARMQPGDYAPARLEDVLQRLRSHATEQTVQRRTARELGAMKQLTPS